MLKFIPIAAVALMSMSAFAVQKDITVTANVDTSLELLSADGSALPTNMKMQYLPGVGLQATSVSTKIFTNDKTKDLWILLAATPSLKNQTNPGAAEIPLKVKFSDLDLSSGNPVKLVTQTLFQGDLADGSIALPLSVEPATVAPVTAAGTYQGLVSMVLTQDAGSEI
ncbi:Cro/Cl family transcriptional regulator [Burkholderia stabilis]|uniref:Cro/Cl family transcriptional regulator n=1 Tax=Burkholderia stabilis TaxID=95485 RepID=A0A4Q2A4M2_9BURK|nr:cable pilus major pilin CblA [Burkholderia stabilis]RXV64206.1 Cro/Cl family transcriptional regulator [Burkholderia stabilis]